MPTKTRKEILEILNGGEKYTTPNGWTLHSINGKYCTVECPECKKVAEQTLHCFLYRRSERCIRCSNKSREIPKEQKKHQISFGVDAELLKEFKVKVESNNQFISYVIAELMIGYLNNQFVVNGKKEKKVPNKKKLRDKTIV